MHVMTRYLDTRKAAIATLQDCPLMEAVLSGEPMPEPGDYLAAEQRDAKPLGADLVYKETWQWLDARGCTEFVSTRLIE